MLGVFGETGGKKGRKKSSKIIKCLLFIYVCVYTYMYYIYLN